MADLLSRYGANWDELGADGNTTPAELTARVMELATGARTAVVIIAGLLGGARSNGAWDGVAADYLQQIADAVGTLADLLPENRVTATTCENADDEANGHLRAALARHQHKLTDSRGDCCAGCLSDWPCPDAGYTATIPKRKETL